MTGDHHSWLPFDPPRPFRLTISCTLPKLVTFLSSLSIYKTPIPLKSLAILHSFAPVTLEGYSRDDLLDALCNIQPEELHIEWYSGEKLLALSSLDNVAATLRKPWKALEVARNAHNAAKLEEARINSVAGMTKKKARLATKAAKAEAARAKGVPVPIQSGESTHTAFSEARSDSDDDITIANGQPKEQGARSDDGTSTLFDDEEMYGEYEMIAEQQMALYVARQAAEQASQNWTAVNLRSGAHQGDA